jgi:hypothetical protein
MSNPQHDAQSSSESEPSTAGTQSVPVVETHPTLKPTMINLSAVIVAGAAIIGYMFANPTLLGTTERTEIAANLFVILTLIGVARFGIRLYVLTRTRYVITADAVRREYSLLYKTFSRELPLGKVRSHELRRSRVETLFGIGSVAFLSGSVAQSPTHLQFENVPDPEGVRRAVRERIAEGPF